ncbi:MAG: DUF47 family protein [Bacteroidales bacterium]|jgi:uncharacterized protein|nr:DUF47 family protein [Bacteroidales bacterium]
MAINSIFSFLTPRETKFFPLLNEMSDKLVEASLLINKLIQSTDREKSKEIYKQIKEVETSGDELINRIFAELNDTFITPFDREDIHNLCERLDDVLDLINSSGKRIIIYNPKHIPEKTIQMSNLIIKGSHAVKATVNELHTITKKPFYALDQINNLHTVEHEADDVYEHFVMELFEKEVDSIELIKIKEIMQELEKTTDRLDAVGKIIKTIIVKYA